MENVTLKSIVNEKYKNFLEILNKFILKEDLKEELNEKINNNNITYFKIFLDNYFVHLQELLDNNEDFFRSQKNFTITKSKGKVVKKKNINITNVIDDISFGKILKYSSREGIDLYFTKLNEIINDFIEIEEDKISISKEVYNYVNETYEINSNKYKRIMTICENISEIISVSSDNEDEDENNKNNEDLDDLSDEEKEKDKDKNKNNNQNKDNKNNSNGGFPDLPFGLNKDFIENSQIGKLAKEISSSINPDDVDLSNPEDFMKSFMSGEGGGGLNKIVKHVFNEVEGRMANNSIDHAKMTTEAQELMGKMGGLGNLEKMFSNMNK